MPADPSDWSALDGDALQAGPDVPARSRLAWCLTGSGHFLDESIALATRVPGLDLFLSAAAEEVLAIYRTPHELVRARMQPGCRVLRDKTASAVPVGMLYGDVYHTVVVAPATSNTVAKCALGISDTLPTNMFAQAGKLGIHCIVFACDTEPVVVTRAPHDWVTLRPRAIEFEHVERLAGFAHCTLVRSPGELESALAARLAALDIPWTTSSS